jgi:hypothetical protein
MSRWDPDTLTDRQRAWFASVRDGFHGAVGLEATERVVFLRKRL